MPKHDRYVSFDHPVKAEAVSHHAQRSKTYGEGRTCRECGTPLTRFNPGPDCYVHTERKFQPMRGVQRSKQ